MTNEKSSIAIAVAAAITLASTIPLSAAPVLTNTAGVKATASNPVTDVRYYRRGYNRGYGIAGPAIIGGLALGVIGAAAGSAYYGNGYYGPGYGPGYYGQPYGGNYGYYRGGYGY